MIKKQELFFLLILLFGVILIFAFNIFMNGSIASPSQLALTLDSPGQAPQNWGLQYWPVFKFRLLFRWIVQGVWRQIYDPNNAVGFYRVYVFFSFLFFYSSVLSLYFLLKMLNFNPKTSLLGSLFFLSSPPVVLAYVYPVCTREDPFAYLFIVLGLMVIIKAKPLVLAFLLPAAILVRETTLILLAVYLLVSNDTLYKKLLVCAPVFVTGILLRIFMGGGGMSEYLLNPFRWSILNFKHPVETISFFFITFGIYWFMGFFGLMLWKKRIIQNYACKVLIKSAPMVLALILGTCVFLGRPREMRVSFMLFPWLIPFALFWLKANIEHLKMLNMSKKYWQYIFIIIVILLLFAGMLVYLRIIVAQRMENVFGYILNKSWIAIIFFHLFLTLILFLIPYLLRKRNIIKGKNDENIIPGFFPR